MQEKKYFNVYYYDFTSSDYKGFVDEVKRQMRIIVRDNQWKDISVEDFEIAIAGKNEVSETKPFRVNIISDSAIYERVINTLTTAMYGIESLPKANTWPENLHKDELCVILNSPSQDDDGTIAIASATLRYLLSRYAPSRISASERKTCASGTVRKMFTHFGLKPQVTRWSDKQI